MDILFLIGNGFDRSAGLKTTYEDVLSSYLANRQPDSAFECIIKDIQEHFKTWCDFEKRLGEITSKFHQGNLETYYAFLRDFRTHMVQYLKAEENRIDYDRLDASRLGILKNFILTPYKYFSEKCQKTITDYINSTFKDLPHYYFVSFNYTSVLDKCLTILHPQRNVQKIGRAEITHFIPKEVLHIHGFLEDNVIMGIDNEAQIVNAELRSDSRLVHTIVKPVINDALENLTNDKIISYMNKSNVICIFGMSIGSTDCSRWKRIGDWLKSSQSRNLLIFSKQDDFDKIHPENKIETMNYVKDSFLKYVENSEKIKRDQIHVCYEADMFNLNLVE